MSGNSTDASAQVFLVGTGVVGRAILRAHVDAGVSVCILDLNEASLRESVAELQLDSNAWSISNVTSISDSLPMIKLHCQADAAKRKSPVVIESILEKLDIKQAFFAEAEQVFGDDAILCSNTSTLRISRIAEKLARPERFCGMHFFMPVYNRSAMEVIAGDLTSEATLDQAATHARCLGKSPLVVGDGPGFVVNRLLSPYLNEAMLMLCRGNSAEKIERAAKAYGMPMSPLELIDWIGTGTMFDAGRAYWQAFPSRLDPAPMLVAMVKKRRLGRAAGSGLYDYVDGQRSADLASQTIAFSESYRRVEMVLDQAEVMHVLSILMWIEAAIAYKEGIVASHQEFDLAMQGGLGYDPNRSWLAFFDELGSPLMLETIQCWSSITKAMVAPESLCRLLQENTPTDALIQFARAA
ncbi:MAG: 3-hydroxyacyl-CoA dehydrogenase family protein [Rubripirellula sp.]